MLNIFFVIAIALSIAVIYRFAALIRESKLVIIVSGSTILETRSEKRIILIIGEANNFCKKFVLQKCSFAVEKISHRKKKKNTF